MTWQSVGQHTFAPTDKAVQVGSFDLAAGQDTIWVKITQLNNPGDWPWSYGILSWRNANGTPLGSIKAYSNRLGEVFRLGVGLPPSDGTGSIWFEPRGFNTGWLRAGFPWELSFEAQSGSSSVSSSYWNRDPVNGVLSPVTSGDDVVLAPGDLTANLGTFGGDVAIGSGNIQLYAGGAAVFANGAAIIKGTGYIEVQRAGGVSAYQAYNASTGSTTVDIKCDGSANFSGNVSAPNITFRSSSPTYYKGETYTGPELDLLEEIGRLEYLVGHLYETLRLTPPAGWEVWDGDALVGDGAALVSDDRTLRLRYGLGQLLRHVKR